MSTAPELRDQIAEGVNTVESALISMQRAMRKLEVEHRIAAGSAQRAHVFVDLIKDLDLLISNIDAVLRERGK